VAWIRFFNALRCRTRCNRQRARSRSPAHTWRRQPDRRHEVPAGEIGRHPRVDPIGLAGQRREALDLDRVGDRDRPAAQLQLVVDEAGAGHRLDHRRHRLPELTEPAGQ
jgi:hypothetical protein